MSQEDKYRKALPWFSTPGAFDLSIPGLRVYNEMMALPAEQVINFLKALTVSHADPAIYGKVSLLAQQASNRVPKQSVDEQRRGVPRHPSFFNFKCFSGEMFPHALNSKEVPAVLFCDTEGQTELREIPGQVDKKGKPKKTGKGIIASFAAVKLVPENRVPQLVYHTLVNNTKTFGLEAGKEIASNERIHGIKLEDTLHHVTPDVLVTTLSVLSVHVTHLVFWDTRGDIRAIANVTDAVRKEHDIEVDGAKDFKFVDIQPKVTEILSDFVPLSLRKQTDRMKLGTAMCALLERDKKAAVPHWFKDRVDSILKNREKPHNSLDDAKAVAVIFSHFENDLMYLLNEY